MWVYLHWLGTVIAGLWLNFIWWRKMKSEYPPDNIYNLIFGVFIFAILGGVIGNRVQYGTWGWWESGGIISAAAALIYFL